MWCVLPLCVCVCGVYVCVVHMCVYVCVVYVCGVCALRFMSGTISPPYSLQQGLSIKPRSPQYVYLVYFRDHLPLPSEADVIESLLRPHSCWNLDTALSTCTASALTIEPSAPAQCLDFEGDQ